MDIPFWTFTEKQKEEATVYIQEFIDNCFEYNGTVITPLAAFPVNDEVFSINYITPTSEEVTYKFIFWGEDGRRKYEERIDAELAEEDSDW